MSSKRSGSWTKVVIFISLYVLLLESLIEWVVVLYLYGNRHVDSKMAPSLILALIASFFTVPLVSLHSFLAWQYNRVIGYGRQKTLLHTWCTYVLRVTTTIWLAASVAGLVVVSQQAFCLPASANGSYWRVGVSCALHRAVVIVSVLSFLTVCLYFCSRELCERPYDVSLLGIYKAQRSIRDDSIFSSSTLESEKCLENDILCVCRHRDVTYGRTPYMASSDNSEKTSCTASIQQPSPIRPTSFFDLSANPDAEIATYLSGSTVTPGPQPGLDTSGVSRTPTVITSRSAHQVQGQALPELPGGPGAEHHSNHKRQKSSVSSLRRFLPKSLPLSLPLSSDPQIRALAEANAHTDFEKEKEEQEEDAPEEPEPAPTPTPPQKEPETLPKDNPPSQLSTHENTLPRSITMNSADAPEVVPPTPVLKAIGRSHTSRTAPLPHTRTIPPNHNQNHNHNPPPTPSPWSTLLNPNRPTRVSTMRITRRQSATHFDMPPHHTIPRYSQSQRYPRPRYTYTYNRHLGRRNDPEPLYAGAGSRHPRSSTYGGFVSVPGHLDCIRETGASIDEPVPPPPLGYRGTSTTMTTGGVFTG